jgi:hypothetical protein
MYRQDWGRYRGWAHRKVAVAGCRTAGRMINSRWIARGLSMLGIATLLLATQPAAAASCSEELQRLSNQWRAVSLPTPERPAVSRVFGKDGRTYTAGQIEYMITQFRLSKIACSNGNNLDALRRISAVRKVLGSERAEQATR